MNKLKVYFSRALSAIRSFASSAGNALRRIFGWPLHEESHINEGQEHLPFDAPINGDFDSLNKTQEETRVFSAIDPPVEAVVKKGHAEQLFSERTRKRPFLLSVLFSTIRFVGLGIVLLGFALLGAGVGIAKAYVETTPVLDRAQLTKSDFTSYLYDKDGRLITTIADVEYRDWADIEQIPTLLQNAFIAVEDIRFYMHSGVDFKRLFSVALEVLGNKNSAGGSTITQQLIKKKILGSERTYKRKIQEAYLALELEKEIEKQAILEAYLNDIHLGESNYGVKTAAKDYFGKELGELTVRECALLAGLTQNPYYYNPRKNKYQRSEAYWVETMERTDTVLGRMYEAGFITLEQYRQALDENVNIIEISEQKQMYDMPYFVEYAIRDVVMHLLYLRDMEDTPANRNLVENELRTGGYHIYTTVDARIQHLVQDTLSEWEKYPLLQNPNKNIVIETNADGSVIETVQPQSSAVVYDYRTGELRAVVGGRNVPTIRKGLNRAYQSYMEIGSSIKPLAVYGPAIDAGASPATVIANLPAPIYGWGTEKGFPYIGDNKYIGPVTMRRGLVSSLNVAAARTLYERVQPEVGLKYLLNLGANQSKINADGPGLALGTSTLTPIQMAAAFGAIAAGGEYKEPLSFTRVVDSQGKIILDAEQVRVKRQVYKPSTAYMLTDMLTDAVDHGTGTNAKISGMVVAGKTGTNSNYRSVYFAGMTPYYSASVWIGHDEPTNILKDKPSGGAYAAPLWQAFMSKIHKGLPNKNIIDTPPSELGLVKKTVCSVSGLLATEACYADKNGHLPVTDWFLEETAPTEECDMHAAITLCSESGQVAVSACPRETVVSGALVLIRPGSYFDQFTDEVLRMGFSNNYVRTSLSLEEYKHGLASSRNLCTLHGGGELEIGELRQQGWSLYADIQAYIGTLTTGSLEYYTLKQYNDALYEAILNENSAQSLSYIIFETKQEFERMRS